ncbi:MAG: exodeoxyribonuclease VII large subunit [Candidatus Omnitrophota bacterium]|nr:exodeoxyribonuclease VII large subunit [Candidatus Omnitrophota bacterium]MDZ4241710.1 exodeoxyribonuclease VII large subunit [Candidatus Omnitrophota bacterium]
MDNLDLFPRSDSAAFSVSQLNETIREVLSQGFPSAVWVCGEIQGYDRQKDKKHVFFELCEKAPVTHEVVAKIGLVIFANRRALIDGILRESSNAFELKDDIEVKFLCKIDFYPPHGAVRLIVESIDPVYTLGKIAQERQRLIALLKQKGLLDKNKGLPLPEVPLNIGLISSHDSAAYNDFFSELRNSGLGFRVVFRNALMQGKGAPPDVCRAIRQLNRVPDLDVIVITRGGGSIAELSCFDNETIAAEIADSAVPVLSGIGHEINITITDMAAHTYQKTPTAIARFLVQRVQDFLSALETRGSLILDAAQARLAGERQGLQARAVDLQARTGGFLKSHRERMARFREVVRGQSPRILREHAARLSDRQAALGKTAGAFLLQQKTRIGHWKKLLDIADPLNTVRRGFSITRTAAGVLVRGLKDVKTGETITTHLADGSVESQVKKFLKEEKRG